MAPAILITECLQHDFVRPLARQDPLPNLLHVGYDEARRLLGDDPAQGPLARTIAWAHDQPAERLLVVHVRDWHDAADPAQAAHFEQFSAHCVRGTDGARFVFDDPPPGRGGVEVVDAITLNDFADTRLADVLSPFADRRTRVGIVGVWTEAKVTFLAYELATRYPRFELAVCPALTASSSRAQHYVAIDQLSKVLGVRVLASIGEFTEFLVPGAAAVSLPPRVRAASPVVESEGDLQLDAGDTELVRYLFRDSRAVWLKRLTGGFSGSLVLAAASDDAYGHHEAAHVVKLGTHEAIGRERAAFERIESVLGNNAPRIVDVAERDTRGAIKYRYASMGRGRSRTFQRLYMEGLEPPAVHALLRTVFVEQLGRLYEAASRERCHLLDYYSFSPSWASRVRARVDAVLGEPADGERVAAGPGAECANVGTFYERDLRTLADGRYDTVSFAWVHGDLNGANIVVDERGNVWLIDFFHAHRGHVLRDLVKLENDLLYIFTPVAGAAAFAQAVALSDALFRVEDLAAGLPAAADVGLAATPFTRAWDTIRVLRSFYPGLLQTDPDPFQLWVAQLRYAVHTLSFHESDAWQKRWALYTAGRCVERIRTRLAS